MTGEAIAWIRNYSNTAILITNNTRIAAVHVSRIREGPSARKKAAKIQELERRGNVMLPDIVDEKMMSQWMKEIQSELEEKDDHKVIEKIRGNMYVLQKKWLARDLNPRTVSIHDPDTEKGGSI